MFKTGLLTFFFIHILYMKADAQQKELVEKKDFSEFTMRGGLPNFFNKASKGDTISVAYFGGSITAQEGWRVLSFNWMKEKFPQTHFKQINAAIGGTGSDFGAFRLNDHVLKYKPDLVFVEFAVNDGSTDSARILRSMEGIVRQIFTSNPYTDICFIYTIKQDYLDMEKNEILPKSLFIMETVADHYKIPSINFGYAVSKMIKEDQLIMSAPRKEVDGKMVFSPDGVHPYLETGHRLYHQSLKAAFEEMRQIKGDEMLKHKVTRPVKSGYFSNTSMINIDQFNLDPGWELVNLHAKSIFPGFANQFKTIAKSTQTGSRLSVEFKGTAFGIYDIMGPDAGRLVVEIDGKIRDTLYRFDKYCTYHRTNYFLYDQLSSGNHKVVLTTLAAPVDKAAILALRNEKINNPDLYKPHNIYLGKILIDGKIIRK
jgi:lysophospholipase L1-like esterase